MRVSPLGPSGLRVLRIPDAPPSTGAPPEVVATIGSFDGVHLGHRALLDVVTRRAAERSVTTAVITFDPHPRRVYITEPGPGGSDPENLALGRGSLR